MKKLLTEKYSNRKNIQSTNFQRILKIPEIQAFQMNILQGGN